MDCNRLNWLAFESVIPGPGDDADIAFTSVSRDFGMSPYRAEHLFYGFEKLSHLPKISRLNQQQWFLDFDRILAVGKALQGVDPSVFPHVDDALVEVFTPSRRNQRLPDAARIRNVISEVLALHNILQGEDEEERDRYQMQRKNGRGELSATFDPITAESIDRLVRKRAEEENISFAKALAACILEPVEKKVVINTYQELGNSLAFLPGYGYIEPPVDATVRHIAPGANEGYRPSARVRSFVEGRDGTCRGPGNCSTPANRCQLDHRVEYGSGGPTSTDNLVCLCQHCHNIKTDRRAFYIMDPITGDIYWLFEDGTWEANQAKGVVVPDVANWRQTVAQRMAAWEARGNVVSFDDVQVPS
ncbi:HNH endonuclease signature motif containing protein [Corynebacterium sp.]|uniref:HNH endonuclease signature motif containing protein n=1 Tax=Corynebacterium sp. TaxID=1720 RepID=UPI0026DB22E2|nr:HNH endonuclease signature motif containing protein [Corynebacterium sp.]MDO5031066.1 HNH endonuclease signature motif containing protein [Corynebacterium sp.]